MKKHTTILFFVIAFAISIPAFVTLTPETPLTVQLPLLLLGSYGPTFAALIVLVAKPEPGERAEFRRRLLAWKAAPRWYLMTVMLPSAIWLLAAVLSAAAGSPPALRAAGLLYLPFIFIVNWGEEAGWRGFILPRLMQQFGARSAGLVLGLIWGLFHVALYWQRPLYALLIFALTAGASVILTWLFVKTNGSILLSTLFHAILNVWGQIFLSPQGSEALFAAVVVLLSILAIFFLRWLGTDSPLRISSKNIGITAVIE